MALQPYTPSHTYGILCNSLHKLKCLMFPAQRLHRDKSMQIFTNYYKLLNQFAHYMIESVAVIV